MILLLLIFLTAPAHADPLTRENAVREALGESPVVAKAAAAADESSWKNTEVIGYLLPTITATGTRYLVKQYEYEDLEFGGSLAHIPLLFPSTQASLLVNWNLFDGFFDYDHLTASIRTKDAAADELDWSRFKTEEDVLQKFNDAIAARELKAVAEQNVATLTDHLSQVTKTRKGGLATQFDVLRVEVQLDEANTDLLRAKDDAILAREKLSQTMGLDPTKETRDLTGDLEIPIAKDITSIQTDGSDRKDLSAIALRTEAAERMSSGASTYWIPKISVGAQYILYNNLTDGLADWGQYRPAWNAAVNVTWTLFDLSQIAKSKEAGYQKVQAEKGLEIARIQLPTDLEFWKKRFVYSAANYEAKVSDVKKSEESVRLAKAGAKAGVRTNTEVLDAELDLFRARAGVVNALKNCAEARIHLELAVGHKLPQLTKNST